MPRRRRADRHGHDGHPGGHHLPGRQAVLVETPGSAQTATAAGSARAAATATSPPAVASSARTSTRWTTPPRAAAACWTRSPATPRSPWPARKRSSRPSARPQALLRRRHRDDLRAVAAPLPRAAARPGGATRTAPGSTSRSPTASSRLLHPLVARVHPEDVRPDRATSRSTWSSTTRRRRRPARRGLPRGRDRRPAPRRRALLPRGLPPPGQAGQLRARDRRRRAPLVALGLAVAGARRRASTPTR